MGCANTKAGATAYGAPEEGPEGDAQKGEVPKVTVDGEQALNGNAVACGNGDQDEKEACNGDLSGGKSEESGDAAAPSGDSGSSAQDGGDAAGKEKGESKTEEEGDKEEQGSSENAESRENQEAEEEKAE